ncbi:50S ribosomal protein L13 [Candidatus Purcelliella pentastirinorum]|uniref:Large ribosomal subunit protein uL13 n=1 Tax=Candidatus Purcelliella pentastirinorum TaxID=472834 RepID=A0AAX3NA01_9ENTR|nr:50S ribosomal protein L13 [Candidatus Purcelliella pentastirinorum]WDI78328.1 50S ribosomal protein L13 [Candidatus Purcelliella pentastirinorum]WDR80646.1 50S ribosomal protein L13 [Candidatus Purcelliella pentastirinorum]
MKNIKINANTLLPQWFIIDASNKILGRLASFVANILRGKHKVYFSPHIDVGDYVIIINAKNIIVSGMKFKNKLYYSHTGYIGGIKCKSFEELYKKYPDRLLKIAVKGMLPKNALNDRIFNKLKVYVDNKHKHLAQCPITLNI